MTRAYLIIFTLITWIVTQAPSLAQDPARELGARALEECHKGRVAKLQDVRLAHFQRSQTLAERAVQTDEQIADGHFALVCSLGEQMRLDGEWLPSPFEFRRMMAELDKTLALEPNHLDALSAKGTILMRIPGFLGGDEVRGEQMLRRVIEADPDNAVNARLVVAKACAARGEHEEAWSLATKALRIAKARERRDLIPEAQATLSELQGSSNRRSQRAGSIVARQR